MKKLLFNILWWFGFINGTNPPYSKNFYLKMKKNKNTLQEAADCIYEMRKNKWHINKTKSGDIITIIGGDETNGPSTIPKVLKAQRKVLKAQRKKKLEKLNNLTKQQN